jgi:hypothetical protein
LDIKFFKVPKSSYSMPLDFLPHFIFPLWQGEPSEGINNEYWAYVGFAPLVLATLAVFLRRDRRTIFLALFALGALSLAVGEANPAYGLIYQLPGFSFFRVPARYLLLFVFAGALLCAIAFDELSNRLAHGRKALARWGGVAFGLLFLFSIWLAETQTYRVLVSGVANLAGNFRGGDIDGVDSRLAAPCRTHPVSSDYRGVGAD